MKIKLFFLFFVSLGLSNSFAQLHDFPNDFKEKAFIHVQNLSSFGFRRAGSEAETKTIEYLKKYFNSIGIPTKIDTFKYKAFELSKKIIKINGKEYFSQNIWINPYEKTQISSKGIIFSQDSSYQIYSKKTVKNKIILASDIVNPNELVFKNPLAIIILPDSTLNTFDNDNLIVNVEIQGNIVEYESFNIIGDYQAQSDKDILITAHWDSFIGPGAADNATGISVLLELSRYFKSIKIPQNIKFIAFGSEELGMIGSKAYVIRHCEDLEKIKFMFNIDNVGGHKDIYIEMRGGVRNVSKIGDIKFDTTYAMYTKTDFGYNWFFNNCDPSSSNVPDWLSNAIDESCNLLEYEYVPGNEMGSDHQVFFLSGVCATNICYYGDTKTHCKEDIPKQVNIEGLEKSGKIVALTIEKIVNAK